MRRSPPHPDPPDAGSGTTVTWPPRAVRRSPPASKAASVTHRTVPTAGSGVWQWQPGLRGPCCGRSSQPRSDSVWRQERPSLRWSTTATATAGSTWFRSSAIQRPSALTRTVSQASSGASEGEVQDGWNTVTVRSYTASRPSCRSTSSNQRPVSSTRCAYRGAGGRSPHTAPAAARVSKRIIDSPDSCSLARFTGVRGRPLASDAAVRSA